jgi:hypothetical protein
MHKTCENPPHFDCVSDALRELPETSTMPLFRQSSANQVLRDPSLVVHENHPPGKLKKPDIKPAAEAEKEKEKKEKNSTTPKTDRSRRTSLVVDGRGANGEEVRIGGGAALAEAGKEEKKEKKEEGGIK